MIIKPADGVACQGIKVLNSFEELHESLKSYGNLIFRMFYFKILWKASLAVSAYFLMVLKPFPSA